MTDVSTAPALAGMAVAAVITLAIILLAVVTMVMVEDPRRLHRPRLLRLPRLLPHRVPRLRLEQMTRREPMTLGELHSRVPTHLV